MESIIYDYYGYKIGSVIYSESEINKGIGVTINGAPVEILCYLTRTIVLTYKVSTNESFVDSSLKDKTSVEYSYIIGYDNQIVAEIYEGTLTKVSVIKIKDIKANKQGKSL